MFRMFFLCSMFTVIGLFQSCGTLEVSDTPIVSPESTKTVVQCGKSWRTVFSLDTNSANFNTDNKSWIFSRTKPTTTFNLYESITIQDSTAEGISISFPTDYRINFSPSSVSILDPEKKLLNKKVILMIQETCE